MGHETSFRLQKYPLQSHHDIMTHFSSLKTFIHYTISPVNNTNTRCYANNITYFIEKLYSFFYSTTYPTIPYPTIPYLVILLLLFFFLYILTDSLWLITNKEANTN